MEKKPVRLVIALFFLCFFCFPICVNAEKTNTENYSIAMVTQLQKFLIGESSSISQNFDINGDKKISATDLTLLKRHLLYGSSSEQTQQTTTTTSSKTTTTLTSTKVTTKATTTSTSAKATTKSTTTSTSAKSTTKVTTTVTSAKASTTVTSTSSITQITTTTMKQGYKLVENSIHNVSLADTKIPDYNENLYEAKDGIFLFSIGKNTYAYTLLSDKPLSSVYLLANVNLIKGAHIWEYTGTTSALYIYDDLPDTSNITFHVEDPTTTETEFEYELKKYSYLKYSDITMVAKIIETKKFQYASDIGTYDYNLNGVLDNGDVEIMIKYFSCDPHNFFLTYSVDAFNRYIKNLPKLGHKNDVLVTTTSTIPVPFAFNIPTADFITNSGYKSVSVPVQILEKSYLNNLSSFSELNHVSDEIVDYIAWVPTQNCWAKVCNESLTWRFQGGFYVYVLKDDGKYCLEWIH